MPEEGVKKLVLVASKFDSGLRDVLRPKTEDDELFGSDDSVAHDIPTAIDLVSRKLRRVAGKRIDEYMKVLDDRGVSEHLKSIVDNCRNPIMVSTMAENMSHKDVSDYSSEEMNVYRALSQYSSNLQADLSATGNFGEIRQVFSDVVAEKEAVLAEKERTLVETAKEGVQNLLYKAAEKAEKHIRILESQDREQLQVQRQQLESQRNEISADVASVFGKLFSLMEENKAEGIQAIREGARENVEIKERTGTTTRVRSYTVSDDTWWKPWTWGDSHTEYYTYEESYTYCLAADAVENLSKYALQGCTQAERAFTGSLKLKSLKSELINIVLNHFDAGDVNFDVSFFKLLVEEKVNAIPLPVFSMDVTSQMNRITSDFTGEITSSSGRNQLQEALSSALLNIADALANQLNREVQKFRAEMEKRAQLLKTDLVKTLVDALEELERQCDAKEAEIQRQKEYIALLKKFRGELV